MTSVNPLTRLILDCKRGSPSEAGDPAAEAALLTAATLTPALINTPVNSNAPQLPLDSALYWGMLPAVRALVAAGAATGVTPLTVGGSPLGQAAFSANPTLVEYVYTTGLDTAVTQDVGVKAVSSRTAVPAERLQTMQFLVSKGLTLSADAAVLGIKADKALAAYYTTSGLLDAALAQAIEHRLQPLEHPYGYALLPDRLNDLYVAVASGSVDAIAASMAAGNPVNMAVLPGATRLGSPLHFALRRGFTEGAQALVREGGADPSMLSAWGQSIVGAAAVSGTTSALHFALSVAATPAAVNAVDRASFGRRDAVPVVAAIAATPDNVVEVVQLLLDAGANPRDASTDGVPCAFWPSYVLMDRPPGFTRPKASAIISALARGNRDGVKADLDEWNPQAKTTARELAKRTGLSL
jgi:hypothetical protein